MRPCGHASKGENIVFKSYVNYKVTCRVLDLIDDISWKLSLEEKAELSVVRLRIDIMNGDRGVAEVTAKNALARSGEELLQQPRVCCHLSLGTTSTTSSNAPVCDHRFRGTS